MTISAAGQTKSFADLQLEFGGAHPITMGEYAAYRTSGSGNTISLDDFAGAAAVSDTQTVTTGYENSIYHDLWTTPRYGYRASSSLGSISDGTSSLFSEATINNVFYRTSYGVRFSVAGTQSNAGWTKMTVGSTEYLRADASFSTSSGETSWVWSSASSNAFGSAGNVVTVVWR